MKLILFLALSLTVFSAIFTNVKQNRFAYLNTGVNNCISVAPLTVSQASGLTSFVGKDSGLTYKWRNLPSWATASGAVITGTPPVGITGTAPLTVDYENGKGYSGSFTFTINYGGLANA
jgi:ABC-type taurine transport system substrate-binding protein